MLWQGLFLYQYQPLITNLQNRGCQWRRVFSKEFKLPFDIYLRTIVDVASAASACVRRSLWSKDSWNKIKGCTSKNTTRNVKEYRTRNKKQILCSPFFENNSTRHKQEWFVWNAYFFIVHCTLLYNACWQTSRITPLNIVIFSTH